MTQLRHHKSFLAKIAPNTQTWIAIVALIVLAVFNYKVALVIMAVGLATVAFGLYLTRVAVKKMRKKNKHAPGFVSMRS
ncbi:hypothetical protein AC1031_002606 [Aphanomyces cochlioides]|nr:hypothetical protein AC1031_002606 [Aphanomyces cochlioides]